MRIPGQGVEKCFVAVSEDDFPAKISEPRWPFGHRGRAAGCFSTACCLLALGLLLAPVRVAALGPGGLSTAGPHRPTALAPPGRLQRLDLGFYFVPLVGYESNYQVTSKQPAGSGIWALEAGSELRYRGSQALRLQLGADGLLRIPFQDAALTEFIVEVPAMLLYRFSARLELALSNHFSADRGKTPPIFIDPGQIDPKLLGGADRTIRYTSVQEELQPLLGVDATNWLRIEAGPYFRFKWVSFLDRAWEGEPDYQLVDGGGSLAALLRWQDRLSFRMRYDIARRLFFGYPARPPARQPVLGDDLRMTRHVLGLRLRGRIWGPFGAQLGYLFRAITDNGGFYAALDHQPTGGIWLDSERVEASANVSYLRRGYRDRTACEAEEEPPGSGKYLGANCQGVDKPSPLPRWESALVLELRVSVTIISWLQAVASYELDDARSELESVTNHRVLVGLGFSL